MKSLVISLVIVGFIMSCLLLLSCGLQNIATNSKEPTSTSQSLRKDLLAETIVNKEMSKLKAVLAEILNGGTIVSRKVKGKKFADGTEVVTETWSVKDAKGNRFTVVWENFILVSVDPEEETETHKPMGS